MPGNFNTPTFAVFFTWPAPNYKDPVDRTWMLPYSIVWMIVSTVLAFGRFYLRLRKQAGTFGFDDILILFAWLFGVGLSILGILGSIRGLGRHTWDVPLDQYAPLVEIGYFAQIFFLVSMCTTKLSVLLFYRRMIKDTQSRIWVYVIWAAITCNVSAGVGTFIVYMVICRPLDAYWLAYQYVPYHWDQAYTCIRDGEGLTLSSCIISVITDFYAVAIPYFMLKQYRLDVPRRQKIGLNVIFTLGWLATGCGIARTYYLWKMGHVDDLTWTGFNLLAWSLAEVHIGIICACAPSMRAFFRQYVNLSAQRSSKRFSRRVVDGGEDGAAIVGNDNRLSARSDMAMSNMNQGGQTAWRTTAPVLSEKGSPEVTIKQPSARSSQT